MRIFFTILFFIIAFKANASSPFISPAKKALQSTVLVYAKNDSSIDLPIRKGAGFIISEKGLLCTLYHNVSQASSIVVTLPDGETYRAKLLGGDTYTDVGFLQIEGGSFPYLTYGNPDEVEVGDWVITAGLPFTKRVAIKKGIVSGIEEKEGQTFFLVDLSFNPGDYGGPLLNLKGEWIGMNFANTTSHQVFGICIPSQTIQFILTQFLEERFFTVLP